MERIAIVGIGWREMPPERLGAYSVSREDRGAWLSRFAAEAGLEESFALFTCNRVELGLVVPRGGRVEDLRRQVHRALTDREPAPGEAERSLRAWAGEGAVEHCFLVAAGMDSAQLGERDVARQVREARDLSRQQGLLGERLGSLLDSALRVAAEVHQGTALSCGRTSLARIALEHGRQRWERSGGSVALLGVSPMTLDCGRELAALGAPLLWVNRGRERAEEAATACGGEVRRLEDFAQDPDPVEVLICATGAAEPVLGRAALERLAARSPSGHPPLVVDLGVPADVCSQAAQGAGVERIGMDDLTEQAQRSAELRRVEAAEARVLVDEALDRFARRMIERRVAPVLAAIQRRFREVALEGLEKLQRRKLANLDEPQLQALRSWAETLSRRFAHLPTAGIKQIADRYGLDSVGTFVGASREWLPLDCLDEPLPGLDSSGPDTSSPNRTGPGRIEADAMKIVIGTRGSALALAQTGASAKRLREAGHEVQVEIVQTLGDRIQDRPFNQVGAAGVFVRELESALLDGRIDLAVHSYKDLPSTAPQELVVAAMPQRVDAADLWLSRQDTPIPYADLRPQHRVGTASARRRALLVEHCPGVEPGLLRGNVPTRVQRLREGVFDAIVLAAAGLERLQRHAQQHGEAFTLLEGLHTQRLDPAVFVPAPTQGALAWQVRRQDESLCAALAAFDDTAVGPCIQAERALLGLIQGGCELPFGGWCETTEQGLRLHAFLADEQVQRSVVEGPEPLRLAEQAYAALRPPGARK